MNEPIPTESRIFADRTCREIRRLEQLYAGTLSPGMASWADALDHLFHHLDGSPIKRVAQLHQIVDKLGTTAPEQRTHVVFAHGAGARRALLCLATFSVDASPFIAVKQHGVKIIRHLLHSSRAGASIDSRSIAFVPWHALARLHQRSDNLTDPNAALAAVAVLAQLVGRSSKHCEGALHLSFDDVVLAGSIKIGASPGDVATSQPILDIRTALAIDQVKADALEQGRVAVAEVMAWLADEQRPANNDAADRIPFLPRREDDFTIRTGVRLAAAEKEICR